MMWGSDYPHSEPRFPQSRKILAEILAGVRDDEQAKIPAATPPACTILTWRGCPPLFEEPTSLRIDGAISDRTAAFTDAAMIEYDDPHRLGWIASSYVLMCAATAI
jgi:hypothetical protein